MRVDPPDQVNQTRRFTWKATSSAATTPEESHAEQRTSKAQAVDEFATVSKQEASVHWEDDQIMIVRITDTTTGEVIQQVPSEQVVEVFRAIQKLLDQTRSQRAIDFEL